MKNKFGSLTSYILLLLPLLFLIVSFLLAFNDKNLIAVNGFLGLSVLAALFQLKKMKIKL
ncbi:hypothetical protein EZL74_11265 [Flavobacterium silvisoli]|uniref:Uncharacterized protein n=1 Tax=Flavobacterium silvisoli TaxID=2529433 RepID=A0A4Q9YRK6_9FLAO|nr:hypothetical protein [Flavobacterium silvisoli]TBX66159.1 hypothetical protein EZL74_11265 [Flavobacterium silvisoli]